MANDVEIRKVAIQPFACLGEGMALVRGHYGLLLGITFVGILLGSLVPFGILMGPMLCGMSLAYLARMRGESPPFDTLFKGFDHFASSVVPEIFRNLAILIMFVPFYIVYFMGLMAIMASVEDGSQPDPAAMSAFFGTIGLMFAGIFVITTLLTMLLLFCEMLIVEYGVSGFDSMKISFKAVWRNFGGLLGLMVVQEVIVLLLALLTCGIGAILIYPVLFGANVAAYRRVFAGPNPVTDPAPADDEGVRLPSAGTE